MCLAPEYVMYFHMQPYTDIYPLCVTWCHTGIINEKHVALVTPFHMQARDFSQANAIAVL